MSQEYYVVPSNNLMRETFRVLHAKLRREWMGVEPTAARNATRHRF